MLENMKGLAESLGWDASSLDLFDIYLQRNETPLSTQLIEELGNKSLLEFIIKQSQHTNKKIDPGLKSRFDLESNESHKKYLINQKEDNIDFESFLEGFRGELNETLHCKEFGPVENLVWEEAESPEPGEHEVVVSIKAAALNFPDF